MVDKNKAVELRNLGHNYQEISDKVGCSVDWCKRNLKGVTKGASLKEVIKLHEVYVAYSKEGALYIGSGEHGRHKHCKSGRSTSCDLNRMVHSGVDFIVEVVSRRMTKDASLELEQYLIDDLKPLYNRATKVVDNRKKTENDTSTSN